VRVRGPRLITRLRVLGVAYRGGWRGPVAAAAAAGVLVATGLIAGRLLLGSAAAGMVAVIWLAWAWRLLRVVPPEPCGGGGPAGTREPRRPKPRPPAGAIALPIPEDPPDDVVALA